MNQSTIVIGIIVGVVLSAGVIFYNSAINKTIIRTDLQIVQQTETEDFYSMFKGSEYIANAIGEMVESEELMNKIIKKEEKLESYLSEERLEKKLKKWNEMVYVDDVTVHGRMSIYVKNDDVSFAKSLSLNVADTIINNNGMYQGEITKKRKIVIVKNQEGDIIEEYEEDDGNYGAHITIRRISGPFVVQDNKFMPIIIGIFGFITVIFIGYLRKVSQSL